MASKKKEVIVELFEFNSPASAVLLPCYLYKAKWNPNLKMVTIISHKSEEYTVFTKEEIDNLEKDVHFYILPEAADLIKKLHGEKEGLDLYHFAIQGASEICRRGAVRYRFICFPIQRKAVCFRMKKYGNVGVTLSGIIKEIPSWDYY